MINILEEMVYKDRLNTPEILAQGVYKDYKFCVISLGSHPTAYVECKLEECDEYDRRLDCIEVHGGFTFFNKAYWDKEDTTMYLGWDYAHSGDYTWGDPFGYGEKWSTTKIIQEVFDVIKQLKVIEHIKRQREGYYL